MKTLTKSAKSRLSSPRIYGYENWGRPEMFHEDSTGAQYFDCVQDRDYPVCNTNCWWIILDGEYVHDPCNDWSE